jgi:hypothetical protein
LAHSPRQNLSSKILEKTGLAAIGKKTISAKERVS